MIGGAEQGAHRIQIIHFGIADSPKWPPLPFPLLAVMSLHPQTLSLAGIISKPYKICALVISSPPLRESCIDNADHVSDSGNFKLR